MKNEQSTALNRYRAGIRGHRILDIRGNDLIFRLQNGSDKTAVIPVTDAGNYRTGEYVDLVIEITGKTSFTVKKVGKTPERFIPADGAEIGE